MSLHATSYFAGVGTVVATMALGFGGGVMLTDAFVGKSERAPTLVERRAVAQPQTPPPVVAAAPAPQPAEQSAAPEQQRVDAAQITASPQQSAQPNAAPLQASAPAAPEQLKLEQSFARASDLDLRARDAEARKTAEAERRKQERRKWAARRKQEMQKIDELAAVSEKVKQAEREREPVVRSIAVGSPAFSVFGDSDD